MQLHRLLAVLALAFALAGAAAPAFAGLQSWTPIGPDGGIVADLAADVAHPGVFYAACGDSGVFATRDGGATWAPASRGLGTRGGFLTIAVDPTSPNRVFAGSYQGLFLSDDFAASWSLVTMPLSAVESLVVSARDGTIYAGGLPASAAAPAIAISRDAGLTWTESRVGTTAAQALLLLAGATGEALYAATGFTRRGQPYLFRSRDGGASWSPLHTGVALGRNLDRLALAGDAARGRLFLSVTLTGDFGFAVKTITLRSTDGGGSWQPSGPGGAPLAVSLDGTVIAGTHRSVDGGATWTAVPTPANPLRFLADPSAPATLLAGTAWGGIFRSTDDGASWKPRRQELAASYVPALVAGPHVLWAAILNGDLESAPVGADDTAIEWVPAGAGLPAEAFTQGYPPAIAVDPQHPRIVYFAWPSATAAQPGNAGGGVARSGNGGRGWHVLPTGSWDGFLPRRLWVDATLPAVLYLEGVFTRAGVTDSCRLMRSDDSGASWTCMDPPDTEVDAFAVAAQSPGRLYAIGQKTNDFSHAPRVWSSADRGSTWTEIPAAGLDSIRSASSLVADPASAARLFLIADGSFLYKSGDGGKHWQLTGRGLPSILYGLAVDPSDPTRVYALGHLGVYASQSSGASFGPLYGGLPIGDFGFVPTLVLDPADPRRLFVALAGHGVYVYTRP